MVETSQTGGFRSNIRLIPFFLSVMVVFLMEGPSACARPSLADLDGIRFLKAFEDVFESSAIRPVQNFSSPLHINITIILHAILGVDEKQETLTTYIWMEQTWFHEFLIWEPSEFGGKQYVALPVDKLWVPDTFITEMVDEDKSPMTPYLYVHYTGKILYGKPLRIVSSCNLNILYFPFDIQKCSLSAMSITLFDTDLKIHLKLTSEEIMSISQTIIQTKGEWELIKVNAMEGSLSADGQSYDIVSLELTMKRRPLFYVVNLLVPSSFLMLTDIFSFYLPTHNFDRASFKMTLMLGYSVFLIIVKELLPNNSAGTPLIAIYFVVCLTFMAVSLIETIFIINIVHEKTKPSRAIPKWVRLMVLHYGAKMFCQRVREPLYQWVPTDTPVISMAKQDCEDHISELCSSPQLLTLHSLLRKIAEDVEGIKQHLDHHSQEQGLKNEWIKIGHILDCFLQSFYVFFFIVFALTLSGTWIMASVS